MKKRKVLTYTGIVLIVILSCLIAGKIILKQLKGTQTLASSSFFDTGKGNIYAIDITGPIFDAKPILEKIEKVEKDKKINALLLRIDSPGGAVGACQEIYSELRSTRMKGKYVTAAISNIGASGAYYIACGADSIVANPGSIIGSIGVIMEFLNIEQVINKLGIKLNVIKAGKYKDIGNVTRKMKTAEEKILKDMADDVHSQFIKAIAESRNLEEKEVRKIADGRVMTGEKAKQIKLIDEIGNTLDAVELLKKAANIEGEAKIIYIKDKQNLLTELLQTYSNIDFSRNILDQITSFRVSYLMRGF